jgi:hypothetical protein
MKTFLAALCSIAVSLTTVDGHGAMVTPRSRNSVDWTEVKNDPSKGIHNTFQHCYNLTGAECNNGQAVYWYSQGCFIGKLHPCSFQMLLWLRRAVSRLDKMLRLPPPPPAHKHTHAHAQVAQSATTSQDDGRPTCAREVSSGSYQTMPLLRIGTKVLGSETVRLTFTGTIRGELLGMHRSPMRVDLQAALHGEEMHRKKAST